MPQILNSDGSKYAVAYRQNAHFNRHLEHLTVSRRGHRRRVVSCGASNLLDCQEHAAHAENSSRRRVLLMASMGQTRPIHLPSLSNIFEAMRPNAFHKQRGLDRKSCCSIRSEERGV